MLVAPLLSDRNSKIGNTNYTSLVDLYKLMTSNELFHRLKDEKIEDDMQISLRLSAQVSIQSIEETDPESMDLFFLLGLLPGGVSPSDLDHMWRMVTHNSYDNRKNFSRNYEDFKKVWTSTQY